MVNITWRLVYEHSQKCSKSPKDISALYIKETVNGKQRFTSIAAYCKCCGALSFYPEWEQKNAERFEVVKRRIPRREYNPRST